MNNSINLTPMLTDLYQLTMAQGYWQNNKRETLGCFHMTFRDYPFRGGYAVACGLEQLSHLIENFHFSQSDIDYLSSLKAPGGGALFNPDFLKYLQNLECTLDVHAVPEGTIVFPHEPIVRVVGPMLQCQIIETPLLNMVSFQTLIATKAARICQAAKTPVAEFGLRRAQGPAGGVYASRAAIVGGCASTSNVLAGSVFGLPVSGTHGHAWVMSFESELEAFRAYARTFPKNCVLLVDTYNVEAGIKNAITVGQEMRQRGEELTAIRIDSGDLAWQARRARKMLDAAGLQNCGICLSNDLDEYTISSIISQGAQVNSWGVGTKLATAHGQPTLGGVYKLSATREALAAGACAAGAEASGEGTVCAPDDDAGGNASAGENLGANTQAHAPWIDHMKVSASTIKRTIPGVLNVRRYFHENGKIAGDMIYDINSGVCGCTENSSSETSSQKGAGVGIGAKPEGSLREIIVDPFDDLRRKDLSNKRYITLLEPLARGGKVVLPPEYKSVKAAQERARAGLETLDESQKRLVNPHTYPVGLEATLHARRHNLACKMQGFCD